MGVSEVVMGVCEVAMGVRCVGMSVCECVWVRWSSKNLLSGS